jgi:stress response protein YsnF
MSKRDPPRSLTPKRRISVSSVTIPVLREEVTVQTRSSKGDTVRVSKSVEKEQVVADGQAVMRTVSIQRIPIDRFVERPTGLRQEGDTLIIPVFEEVPVVVMKTKLKEEVRVTTRTVSERRPMPVDVRREQVSVERIPADTPQPACKTKERGPR